MGGGGGRGREGGGDGGEGGEEERGEIHGWWSDWLVKISLDRSRVVSEGRRIESSISKGEFHRGVWRCLADRVLLCPLL